MGTLRLAKAAFSLVAAVSVCSCGQASDHATQSGGCIERAHATYDSVVLVQRADGTLWVSNADARYQRIDAAHGALLATDSAASGSSAYGDAIGCAIPNDGSTWCFPLAGPLADSTDLGANLGSGVTTTQPVQVVSSAAGAPLSDLWQLSGGMNGGGASFCGVKLDGSVWCWGYNPGGLLGHADTVAYARPVLDAAGSVFSDVADVRVGFGSTCARKVDGSVWCWGDNSYGQLGVAPESLGKSLFPVAVALPRVATRLAASPGDTHCAVLADTTVMCWGRNEYAEAGAPDTQQTATPTPVLTAAGLPLYGVSDLAPDRGMKAMCANTESAGLVCWGDPNGPDATPIDAMPPPRAIQTPLAAFGARDGKLVYVTAQGQLVFGAGSLPAETQPPCP